MGFLGRLFARRLSDLVTVVVEPSGHGWETTWISDGLTPGDFKIESLEGAIARVDYELAVQYSGQPEAARGQLQYAIYPWGGRHAGDVILDVRAEVGGLVARDQEGADIATGVDIHALVAAAADALPDPSRAMLRWIKRVRDLPGVMLISP